MPETTYLWIRDKPPIAARWLNGVNRQIWRADLKQWRHADINFWTEGYPATEEEMRKALPPEAFEG